ncbi:MAG: isoprenylcysteine carboxylmethyltransferase family protein [Planctomycetota bacterium]
MSMMVRDLMRHQGERLFRYRSYVPLLLVPMFFLALRDSEWIEIVFGDFVDDIYDWMCVLVSLSGVILRVATVGYVPKRTSGRNTSKGQVADELNTTGMYSIVRNPLYLANVIIMAGVAFATGSLLFTAVTLLAYCLHYERIICCEEDFLSGKFGNDYAVWLERTPAFFPRLSQWTPSARTFCWRTALKREYLTGFSVLTVFTVIDYLEDMVAAGRVEFEGETTALFISASLVFLLIRYVRKSTDWLSVAGR